MPYRHTPWHRATPVVTLMVATLACADTTLPPNSGFIEVLVVTSGETLDSDGYTLAFRGKTVQTRFVAINGTLAIQLEEGEHQVELLDVAVNCEVAGENPRAATVAEGETTRIAFEVTCTYVLREIAFSRDRDVASQGCTTWSWYCHDLYLMGANGAGLIQLTNSPEYADFQPDWSPDGSRIAFAREAGDQQRMRIYVVNTDGSGATALTGGALDSDPAWAPDGSRIAFVRTSDDGDRSGVIYLMDADGSNPVPLLGSPGSHSDPAWSPDGSRIAFSSYAYLDDEWQSDIYVMATDGSDVARLTTHPADDSEPAWSPDGSRIAFVSARGDDRDSEIYTIAADASSPAASLGSGVGDDSGPTWSPDGTRIVFSKLVDGSGWEVFVMAVDGSDLVNITGRPGYDGSPAWRPRAPNSPEADG